MNIKKLFNINIEEELCKIGFDKTYIHKAKDKFGFINFKIFDLTCVQANIIKQTALSVGADCATHREVITGKIEKSDAILGGSVSQLQKIANKLELQPFGLKSLGQELLNYLSEYNPTISQKVGTRIMGILNITPDSFSDGGQYFDIDRAVEHFYKLENDGADIVDIGAESTRPNFEPVSPEIQLERLVPLLKKIAPKVNVSIDTRSSEVAKKCIELGANIINDVSGFDFDLNMAEVIALNPQTKIIIQHWRDYLGMDNLFKVLSEKVEFALSKGIKKENIIIDPGIGFGKTKDDNFEILDRWQELQTIGCPIMVGISRKSLLGMPNVSNEEKDLYTLALNANLMQNGIDYIRVHNVEIHNKFMNIKQSII